MVHLTKDGKKVSFVYLDYDISIHKNFKNTNIKLIDLRYKTVQGTLNNFISKRFNTTIKTTGASRTDKGVHAKGQVIHFDLHINESVSNLEYVLNRLLPNDIRVYNISLIHNHTWTNQDENDKPEIFHATGSALGKIYKYHFFTGRVMDPLRARYCAHIYQVNYYCKLLFYYSDLYFK
jgi:tRNA pseudouridine38-40 synthase